MAWLINFGIFKEATMSSKFAVIQTGGKQYRVAKGDKVKLEKIDLKEGSTITFDEVLLLADGDELEIGKPKLENVTVSGKLLTQGKAQKLTVFKFKPKKRYQKKQGHRQSFSEVEITEIKKSTTKSATAKKVETPKAAKTTTTKKPAAKKDPSKPAAKKTAAKKPAAKKTEDQ
jgi:large subunit ribosomal protein L21